MSRSPTMTVPATLPPVSSWRRLTVRKMVVLPHPEGPTRAVTRLRTRSSDTSRTTRWCPNVTLTWRRETAAGSSEDASGERHAGGVSAMVRVGVPSGAGVSTIISVLRTARPSYASLLASLRAAPAATPRCDTGSASPGLAVEAGRNDAGHEAQHEDHDEEHERRPPGDELGGGLGGGPVGEDRERQRLHRLRRVGDEELTPEDGEEQGGGLAHGARHGQEVAAHEAGQGAAQHHRTQNAGAAHPEGQARLP